jgi:hypothetical protein
MPKRPKVKHRDIVNAQQDLLKWCPNVEGVSNEDLVYVCWACGARSAEHFRSKQGLMTRCHIERYQPNQAERPDNFILLCDLCHKEQPDALPKEAIKYWLSTRESHAKYNERMKALFNTTMELLKKDFGDFVVDMACAELGRDVQSWMMRYAEKSAGQGSGNRYANFQWGWLAEFYKWCVGNKEKVELDYQNFERAIDAARHNADDGEQEAAKQLELFT